MKQVGVKKELMKWTQAMDDVFVKAMLNQHYEGNHVKGSFTPPTYINMVKELNVLLE